MCIQTHSLLQSTPVQYVLATSQVEEWATSAPDALDGCTRNVLESAQYRRKMIGPATPARPHRPSNRHHQLEPPLRLPNRSMMMFNFLQLNANRIGNKLTELGVVLEINKVKVAVIQESKLSSKSKNPCIQNYTLVRNDRSHG